MKSPDNCPASCSHRTFHYCADSGTHCDKHCVCNCRQCKAERQNPGPPNHESGGRILPGAIIVGQTTSRKESAMNQNEVREIEDEDEGFPGESIFVALFVIAMILIAIFGNGSNPFG